MKKLHEHLTTEEKDSLSGHRDRLRKRYLTQAEDCLDDNRMLELLLTYAIPRKDVYLLANSLIQHFGDIGGVFDASVSDLMSVEGVGEKTAILIHMVSSFQRRRMITEMSRKRFSSPDSIGQELCRMFYGVKDERILVATFNSTMSLISYGFVAYGKSGECDIDKCELMKYLVKNGVAYVAIAHNHPCGSIVPTSTDLRAMRVLQSEVQDMKIKLVDMFVISGNCYYKMKDAAKLSNHLHTAVDGEISYVYGNSVSEEAIELTDAIFNADI